jgi:hypothetical protein
MALVQLLSREEDLTKGILSTHLHSEGQHAEELSQLHQEWEQGGLQISSRQRLMIALSTYERIVCI